MHSLLLLVAVSIGWAGPVVRVPGGPGAAARIQAVVDACPTEGCVIQLPDVDYPMGSQVWIEGKSDIVLEGTGTAKPRLYWPDSLLKIDTTGAAKLFSMVPPLGGGRLELPAGWLRWPRASSGGVGTLGDSLATSPTCTLSRSGFQHNGMFLVKRSDRIAFKNLILDGNRPAVFLNRQVWSGSYDLVHGSVGVSLFQSRACDFSRVEVRRFWTGLYMQGSNNQCASWWAEPAFRRPFERCGLMGGHLVERSVIERNWYGVFLERDWDMGSVFRENLFARNFASGTFADSSVVSAGISYNKDKLLPGAAIRVHDTKFPAPVLSQNVFFRNGTVVGTANFRTSNNGLFSGNIVVPARVVTTGLLDEYHLGPAGSRRLWNNVLLDDAVPVFQEIRERLVTDSGIEKPNLLLKVKDSVKGSVAGGNVVIRTLTRTDTIDGFPVVAYFRDTTTYFYDTLPGTPQNCRMGCLFPLEPPIEAIRSWTKGNTSSETGGSFWGAAAPVAGANLRANIRTTKGLQEISWREATAYDSIGPLPYNGLDQAASLARRNWHCTGCKWRDTLSGRTGYLEPDWSQELVKNSIATKGLLDRPVGAFDRDGRWGGHSPIRVRATGMPSYDSVHKKLLLPVSLRSEVGEVDSVVVLRIQAAARNFQSESYPVDESPRNVGVVDAARLVDGELRVAIVPVPTDSVVQVDVWMAGLRGKDTLLATPASWVWSPKAPGSWFGVGVAARGARNPRIQQIRSGGMLRLRWQGGETTTLALCDARGRVREVAVVRDGTWNESDLGGLPRGLWFPRLVGAAAVLR